MRILTAPYYALFSADFYRDVIGSSLRQGILYLVYLSGCLTILFAVVFAGFILPRADAFSEWAASEMPPMTWTPEGLVMDGPSPYAMVHPDYGLMAVIDMTRTELSEDEMGDAAVHVTSRKLYVRDGRGGMRIHSLTRSERDLKPDQLAVFWDGARLREFYGKIRPWIFAVPAALAWPLLFVLKAGEAVLFSLPAFFIARTRREPLDYAPALNVSCFALTASTLIELRWMIPAVSQIPFGFIGAAIVTAGYLVFALKKTEYPEIPPAV